MRAAEMAERWHSSRPSAHASPISNARMSWLSAAHPIPTGLERCRRSTRRSSCGRSPRWAWSLCGAHDGQDVGRRVPAHHDRTGVAQDTPIILLDEPTSFLDMPNRYELCTLLARLAHEENKCILFSTHELDIALSLADAIALIDPPQLSYMPTEEMRRSGCIERLFRNNCVTFDATTGFIKVGQ